MAVLLTRLVAFEDMAISLLFGMPIALITVLILELFFCRLEKK